MINFIRFAVRVPEDARLSLLIAAYDDDPTSLTDDERAEMVTRFDRLADEVEDEDEDEYPEDDYYEDWDNLEMGFDPYMGCYSDDC
jgi:hypothetical protein